RLPEALVMLLVVVAVGRAVFSDWLPVPVQRLEFLGIPALVWVAFRFGQREAATATLVMSALAIWGTVQGVGPFAGASSNVALLSLQAYMSIIALTALVLAAAVDYRRRADLARLDEARDRVRAHEALEKSEELHRGIAELASDFAVIVRVEPDGTVALESTTEGFRRVTGYEPGELGAPGSWRRLLDTASVADAQSAGQRVLAGERVSFEVRIITSRGVERWLRCHAEPFGGARRRRPHPGRGRGCHRAAADRRDDPPASRGDPRAVHARAANPRSAADPAGDRRDRRRARPAPDRGALEQHPDESGEGGGDRHDRRRDDDSAGRPAAAERHRSLPAAGRVDHHDGPVAHDCRRARLVRRGPRPGPQPRRPAKRHGRGRAPAARHPVEWRP